MMEIVKNKNKSIQKRKNKIDKSDQAPVFILKQWSN